MHPENFEEARALVRNILKVLKKSRSRAEYAGNTAENCAPVRSSLKFLKKIALACGVHSSFFIKNCAGVRSILKLSSRFLQDLRSRVEHPENSVDMRLIKVNHKGS